MKNRFKLLLIALTAGLFTLNVNAQVTNTSPLPGGTTNIGGHLSVGDGNEIWGSTPSLYFNYHGSVQSTYFWNGLGGYGTSGKSILTLKNTGYVGIGTEVPISKLHVMLDNSGAIFDRYGAVANTNRIVMRKANGTEGTPTIVSSSDVPGNLVSQAYDGNVYRDIAGITFQVDGTPASGIIPGRLAFSTMGTVSGTPTERMRITSAGNVGVGTTVPSTKFHIAENASAYAMTLENTHTTGSGLLIKAGGAGSTMNLLTITDNAGGEILKVRGSDKTMYVRELEVKIGAFPDYVFEKNYPLMPLSDLESYINTNKHLPNVPSAQEVETNGANVGELVKVQMEKIEELTLYLIELKKENETIKKENQEIKKENEAIITLLKDIKDKQ